jgi:hypothetical protein
MTSIVLTHLHSPNKTDVTNKQGLRATKAKNNHGFHHLIKTQLI